MTSNDGFSVVAPIRVTVPSSTAGSRASCWALLNRWISSMKRTVRSTPAPGLAGLGDRLAELLDAREHRRERHEPGPGSARRGAGPASSCPCPALPRGSARAAARPPRPAAGPAAPAPTRCAWPTNSSRSSGRIRSARGASRSILRVGSAPARGRRRGSSFPALAMSRTLQRLESWSSSSISGPSSPSTAPRGQPSSSGRAPGRGLPAIARRPVRRLPLEDPAGGIGRGPVPARHLPPPDRSEHTMIPIRRFLAACWAVALRSSGQAAAQEAPRALDPGDHRAVRPAARQAHPARRQDREAGRGLRLVRGAGLGSRRAATCSSPTCRRTRSSGGRRGERARASSSSRAATPARPPGAASPARTAWCSTRRAGSSSASTATAASPGSRPTASS